MTRSMTASALAWASFLLYGIEPFELARPVKPTITSSIGPASGRPGSR